MSSIRERKRSERNMSLDVYVRSYTCLITVGLSLKHYRETLEPQLDLLERWTVRFI